jgi:predicted esterase
LEQALVDAFGKMDDTLFASLGDSVALLRSMQAGTVQEIDYPAARRLRFCEAMLKTHHASQPTAEGSQLANCIVTEASETDVWLSLAIGRKNVPVRLRAPREVAAPLPVLFLFHGAGGSENMFFETYGAGRAVEEGLKRGWLVVAPRQGLFGLSLDVKAMLDVLDGLFEIDRSQVFLIGHSMGAGQVIRQAGLHPQLPLAAVALGGGGRPRQPEAMKDITWFVGAGEQDFGRSGAQQLHKSLTAAKVTSTYRDYPDVEHMVIVQAAIDDVFQFLDAQLLELRNAN